jgi:hypothetical protein
MYAVNRLELIYHLTEHNSITLCGEWMLTPLDQRRRFTDYQIVSEVPADRVLLFCSKCAELSGDSRSFKERVTYPSQSHS